VTIKVAGSSARTFRDLVRCLFRQTSVAPCSCSEGLFGVEMAIQKSSGLWRSSFTKASPLPYWGMTLARFGYPNEEAFGDWMLTGVQGIGFYEILNSNWPQEIVAANRERFPETPDDLGVRHFMVACKENTLEVLAEGFSVSRVRDRSWITTVTEHLQA
jgi:hypothetical protein